MKVDEDSINSEIRYITIELMKIAAQRNITFEEASREFLRNATFLKRLIEISESTDQMSRVLMSNFNLEKKKLYSLSERQQDKETGEQAQKSEHSPNSKQAPKSKHSPNSEQLLKKKKK